MVNRTLGDQQEVVDTGLSHMPCVSVEWTPKGNQPSCFLEVPLCEKDRLCTRIEQLQK